MHSALISQYSPRSLEESFPYRFLPTWKLKRHSACGVIGDNCGISIFRMLNDVNRDGCFRVRSGIAPQSTVTNVLIILGSQRQTINYWRRVHFRLRACGCTSLEQFATAAVTALSLPALLINCRLKSELPWSFMHPLQR